MTQNIIGDSDSDITFKINGKTYNLHKNIIAKSLFFKTLLDNEQFMGIKDDEIIIGDVYNVPINSDYVDEVLGLMYDNDVLKIDQSADVIRYATADKLIKSLNYYILFDFFQIDNLKEICMDLMSKMMPNIYPKLPNRIEHVFKIPNFPEPGSYKCNGRQFYVDPLDEITWKSCRKDFEDLAKIIYDGIMFYKKYAGIYFDTTIKRLIDDEGDLVKKHIINRIKECEFPEINIFMFKYNDTEKKIYMVDEFDFHIRGGDFIDFILGIYHNLHNGTQFKLYWIMDDRKNSLPIEIVGFLMDIFPNNRCPAMLLDTSDWKIGKSLNWPRISQFENICIRNNNLLFFEQKLRAYLKLYHFADRHVR